MDILAKINEFSNLTNIARKCLPQVGKMDRMHGTLSLLAIAAFVICSLSCQIQPVLTYSLTSQYIGSAPSSGNEHLLLFKLPEAISTQLLESQTTNLNNRQTDLQFATKDSKFSIPASNFGPVQQPMTNQQPELDAPVQEQSVSLTIPLSTLHAVDQSPTSSNYVSANRLQANEAGSAQQTSQLALELAVADYIEDHTKRPHGATGLGQTTFNQGNLNHGHLDSQLTPTAPSNYANQDSYPGHDRRSFIQQPYLQPIDQGTGQIYIRHYTNQSQQQIDTQRAIQPTYVQLNVQRGAQPQMEAPVGAQPSLWRDTQAATLSPANNFINGSDIPNILARLSSSSPDLLLRLKNLLKRSAGQQRIGALNSLVDDNSAQRYSASNTNLRLADNRQVTGELDSHSELLMANNVAPSELHNLFKNYLRSQDLNEPTSRGERSLISSQNVTSHQEIKIPLIVIAMPRILSLRRSRMNANSTNSPHNSTEQSNPLVFSHKFNRQPLTQSIAANLTHSGLVTANGTHLYQISSSQPIANYSEVTITNSSNLYQLAAQQQYSSTTSLPIHTMAPYAQQFTMPRFSSSPLIRQFVPLRQRETSKQQAYYLPNYLGQMSPQIVANQSGSYELSSIQLARPTSHLTRQLFDPNVGRQSLDLQNTSDFRGVAQQTVEGTNVIGGPNYSTIGTNFPESRQHSSANVIQKNQLADSVLRSSLPVYYVQQTQDQINDNQQQQQQPQLVYFNTTAQRRTNSLMARQPLNDSNYDQPAQTAIDDTVRNPGSQRNDYHHTKNIDLSSLAASRISLLEEQLRRLRPLFQSNKRYNPQETSLPEMSNTAQNPKLSPSQLVTLFSGVGDQKSLESLQEKEDESNNRQSQNLVANKKKSPKMVLMIV